MKNQIRSVLILACGLAASSLQAEELHCTGILGNSGEQGTDLVRFNASKPATGLGVVADRYGALWNRGGAGVLNRYGADGRLLASYRISDKQPSLGDAIAAIGETLILCLSQELYTLPVDAPAGTQAKPLKIPADQMSLSSHDGWVVASKGLDVFLVNTKGEKKAVTTLLKPPLALVLESDGAIGIIQDWKAYRPAPDAPGGLALIGPVAVVPGERPQALGGYLYGAGHHSTLRRCAKDWQPAPGVVLGGNSGSFIGHVDEQSEVVDPRGLAKAGPNLFAISGPSGILHLLEWHEEQMRFDPVRRIGCIPACAALALDRDGRVWWLSGNWKWEDGPATPLHLGVPEPEIAALTTMQDSNTVVGYGILWGKPTVLSGKLDKEVRLSRIETPTALPKEGVVAVAALEQKGKPPTLLILEKKGGVTAVNLAAAREGKCEMAPVQFLTSTPVKEWTSLAATGPDSLIAAADGNVISLSQDGNNWKETRRWNSWGTEADSKFGGAIWISADEGKLWVSDSARHRVVCFDLSSGRELAVFGTKDLAGDNLARLDAPRVLAARGRRAVVFDSGNQRLVKLEIK